MDFLPILFGSIGVAMWAWPFSPSTSKEKNKINSKIAGSFFLSAA